MMSSEVNLSAPRFGGRLLDRLGKTVASRMLAAVILFSSAVTLILTGVQLHLDYRSDIEEIDATFQRVQRISLPALTESVWVFDEPQIATQLEGISRLSDIDYVAIRVEDKIRWQYGVSLPGSSVVREFPLLRMHRGEKRSIGTLIVDASLYDVYWRLARKAGVILASNGLKTFLVALFMLAIFQYLIARHLAALARYARQIGGGLDTPLIEWASGRAGSDREPDEIGQVAGALRDMHQEVRDASQLIRDERERNRLLLDSTGEGIYGIDRRGCCTFANPACARMLGFEDPAQLVGRHMHDLIHHHREDGAPLPEADCRIHRAQRDGVGVHADDEVFWRSDGSSFAAEYRSFPMGRDGQIVGAVVTFSDISARRRAQRELSRLNEDLEGLVRQRTAALEAAQTELVRKERLSMLGQLTATVSHEIRNPLGAIRAGTHVLKRRLAESDSDLSSVIERIDRSVIRCDGIIDELLEYARVRPLDTGRVAVGEWLSSVVDEYIVPDGIVIARRLASPDPLASLDRERMRRVIVNLLDNACQAMQTAGIADGRIEIGTAAHGDTVEISVTDNGPGVPDEAAAKIFEPLFSTRNFGVGLGLAIVRDIVRQHGGDIVLDSQAGRGARFVVGLPLDAAP